MSFPYPYKGPISPENNPPIEPQYFQPSRFVIVGITLGANTTITTYTDHNYVIGQQVRLLVPEFYGSYQLNGMDGYVIAIPAANEVVVNINSSRNINWFVSSPVYAPTPPQIVAIGDILTGSINALGNIDQSTLIPGSFINISPL